MASTSRAALSVKDFSNLAARCGLGSPRDHRKIVVALSGGADSTALALLAHQWAPGRVHAVTIDHKLRPESTNEALNVASKMRARGIPHSIFTFPEVTDQSKSEDRSRIMRYKLLAEACQQLGADSLCLAHHAEDNIETVIYRLSRASGLRGLSGIPLSAPFPCPPQINYPAEVKLPSVHRPFLSVSKHSLVATCRENNYEDFVVEAPGENYRDRIRPILKDLYSSDNPYLNFNSLFKFTKDIAHISKELEEGTLARIRAVARLDPAYGIISLNFGDLRNDPNSWIFRKHLVVPVLSAIELWVSRGDVRSTFLPLFKSYRQLIDHLSGKKILSKAITLRQSLLYPPMTDGNKTNHWLLASSPPANDCRRNSIFPINLGDTVCFDQRFFVTLSPSTLQPDIIQQLRIPEFRKAASRALPKLSFDDSEGGNLLKTHNFIVRHLSQNDVSDLASILYSQINHPAMRHFRRSYRDFKYLCPLKARFGIPVIAAVPKSIELQTPWPNDLDPESGVLVAVPSLGINLLPDVIGFKIRSRWVPDKQK